MSVSRQKFLLPVQQSQLAILEEQYICKSNFIAHNHYTWHEGFYTGKGEVDFSLWQDHLL